MNAADMRSWCDTHLIPVRHALVAVARTDPDASLRLWYGAIVALAGELGHMINESPADVLRSCVDIATTATAKTPAVSFPYEPELGT